GAQQLADARESRHRSGVAVARPLDELMRVCTVAPQLPRNTIGRVAGCDRLQMAVPVAISLARLPACLDDDVAELSPTAVEMVVDHDPAADARAKREHDEVARPAPGAQAPLRERSGVAVVFDPHRQVE